MESVSEILIQPLNPKRINPDDLLTLAGSTKALNQSYSVRIATYEKPPDVPGVESEDATVDFWEQVLYFWLPATFGAAVINQVVALAVEWAKQRLKEPDSEDRPVRIEIIRYENERGEITEIITIENADSPSKRKTVEQNKRYPMLKPSTKKDSNDK